MAAMVRLAYTCPNSGVVILGTFFSEEMLARHHDMTALVDCPYCQRTHSPRVSECRMFPAKNPPVNLSFFLKHLPKPQ
jgi:hypothetical protein